MKAQKNINDTKYSINITKKILRSVNFVLLTVVLLLIPSQNVYSFRSVSETYSPKIVFITPSPMPYPIKKTDSVEPELTAEGVMVIDVLSGTNIYQKNPDVQFYPASTTKIMTALVALADYSLSEVVTVRSVITEGQTMGLAAGETITVENLLFGILVHSANDAAFALAEHYSGGAAAFIDRMNLEAKKLKLTNTHFVNPIGFDDPEHYTTPRDLALLSRFALENPVIRKMTGIAQITVPDTTYSRFHPLKNINQLLGKIPGVSGLKTGYTQIAGQALVTTVDRDGHEILFVVLKSKDRFKDTENLINWVFNNFQWKEFSSPN